jgi:hypothetical protein
MAAQIIYNLENKDEIVYVSLGGNCSIAYQLNKYGLRRKAYPFDWCKSDITKLITVLENNFEGYSDIEYIKKSDKHEIIDDYRNTKNKSSIMFKNIYGIRFAHEIEEYTEDNLILFKKTIERRIERFRKLKQVIFVRIELQRLSSNKISLYNKLSDLLDLYFDDYKIIIISNNINKDNIIKCSNIIYHNFNEFDSDWKMDTLNWSSIFNM